VYFELEVTIEREPAEVFAFLRDKDLYPRESGSPVLALDQITPDPPGVGTRYREVVRMMPFVRASILSEITRFDPPHHLEEEFNGAGMRGHLAYEFSPRDGGTLLVQRETVEAVGAMKILAPLAWRRLGPRLRERLEGIKRELDSGWVVNLDR
jgi:uncharacterized protein YndB with AHSA1/START domain